MNIKHVKTLKNGKRHVLVELDEGERIAAYHENRYYKLGYPCLLYTSDAADE